MKRPLRPLAVRPIYCHLVYMNIWDKNVTEIANFNQGNEKED